MMNDNAGEEVVAPVDYPKLLDNRCRGKKDLAARLLRNLCEDSGPRWLLEAENAAENGDMAGAARIGHSIKGSCKMICAGTMVSAGMVLEDAGKDGSQARVDIALEELKIAFSETRQWLRRNSQLLE